MSNRTLFETYANVQMRKVWGIEQLMSFLLRPRQRRPKQRTINRWDFYVFFFGRYFPEPDSCRVD